MSFSPEPSDNACRELPENRLAGSCKDQVRSGKEQGSMEMCGGGSGETVSTASPVFEWTGWMGADGVIHECTTVGELYGSLHFSSPEVPEAHVIESDGCALYRTVVQADGTTRRLKMAADDPETDGTTAAHPAWHRGNEDGVAAACYWIEKVFEREPTETLPDPLHSLRRKIWRHLEEERLLQFILDKQSERTVVATKEWQDATGNPGVLPDFGKLVDWLRAERDRYKDKARELTLTSAYVKGCRDQLREMEATLTALCEGEGVIQSSCYDSVPHFDRDGNVSV